MAEATRFVCTNCAVEIIAWSDGNPYFVEGGEKQYAYHPNHPLLARCIGNDVPHLCLSCGHPFTVDSRAPIEACPECGATAIVDQSALAGEPCPYCDEGRFQKDPGYHVIS